MKLTWVKIDPLPENTFQQKRFSLVNAAVTCYTRGHRGRNRIIYGYITTYGISAYHH